MKPLEIESTLAVQRLRHGPGFSAFGVRAEPVVLDPYLMVDHYRMSEPTFAAHPHAGFSAVTYMFDDAQTGFRNRDSRGDDSVIGPGDLHWTIAGAGVVHEETPIDVGRTAHGLQIFVNLPAAAKHMPPGAIHIERQRMPVIEQPQGARVVVAFGAYDDGRQRFAPVAPLPTAAALLDVKLGAGAAFDYPVAAGDTAFALVIAGEVEAGSHRLAAGQAAAWRRDGGRIDLRARSEARVAVFLGTPLREPVFRHGPFAMASEADLARAIDDFRAGRMGSL